MSSLDEYLSKITHNVRFSRPKCVLLADELLASCIERFSQVENMTSATLFITGFGSWRASIALASGGATSQVPVTLRHALECCLYDYLFSKDAASEDTWWNREADPKAKKKMRGKSGPIQLAKEHLSVSNPTLKDSATELMDALIDFGAHPNVMIFADSLLFKEDEDADIRSVMLLGSEEARDSAHLISVTVATEMIKFFREIWPTGFDETLYSSFQELIGQSKTFKNYHHSINYS